MLPEYRRLAVAIDIERILVSVTSGKKMAGATGEVPVDQHIFDAVNNAVPGSGILFPRRSVPGKPGYYTIGI
jgi:hypothetical protein